MRTFSVIVICVFLFYYPGVASQLSEDCYSQGVISIKAEHFTIVLKDDLRGFIFDTSANRHSKNPAGKFENLKIDSLIFMDSVVAYSDSLYGNLYAMHCGELLNIMADINARKLARLVLKADLTDIIEWVEARQKWVLLNDMSKFYGLYFSPDSDEIKIADRISKIPDIKSSQANYWPCCNYKPDSTVTINDQPPVFDSNQSSFTHQELLDAAYSLYSHPEFNEPPPAQRYSVNYLNNSDLYSAYERSKHPRFSLSTDNSDSARAWIDRMVKSDTTHLYQVDSVRECEKYYEYYVTNTKPPMYSFVKRIHKKSYFDNSRNYAVDRFYYLDEPGSSDIDTLGSFNYGNNSSKDCREFMRYLIHEVQSFSGRQILSVYAKADRPCSFIMYYFIKIDGDFCMFDEIMLYRNIYSIDDSTNLVTVEKNYLQKYKGVFCDYDWPVRK